VIDRFGNRVSVAWPEHHLIMIEAALTLPFQERQDAFRDIAEITTRTLPQVRNRAYEISRQAQRQSQAHKRRVVMRLPAHWQLGPSQLKQPTKLQLMGRR
jgi:hypothetical protein